MIDAIIIRSDEEVSPLLKFYNELSAHSNFRLPLRSLLQFDINLFRAQLEKIKRCHKVQLRYVKKAAKDKAGSYLQGQFESVKNLLIEEMRQGLE